MTQSQQQQPETIIRFSAAWWVYVFLRLGALRALVNGVEDALAITGRFLLLVFLIYCGAKAGALLVDPKTVFPVWLEMGMFVLQLAGLEGSIPGLARQADALRATDQDGAKKLEKVMLSARVMTVLSITEGALHALHVDAMALQFISAGLLVVRGIVITGFLIALAKIENKAPRVLSKDAHAREEEQQAQNTEQARTITDLRTQLDEAREALEAVQQQAQQNEKHHEQFMSQLREQMKQMESAQTSLLTGTESQDGIIRNLQAQLAQTEDRLHQVTASLEQKGMEYERVSADLQTANGKVADLQRAALETANLQTANLQRAALETTNLQSAHLQSAGSGMMTMQATPSAKTRPAKDITNIRSIDQARAKHEGTGQGRAKMSHAEVLAFMAEHPELKRAEVASQLDISERKVYDALAWQKEQVQAATS